MIIVHYLFILNLLHALRSPPPPQVWLVSADLSTVHYCFLILWAPIRYLFVYSPLSSTPSTQANNPSLIAKYLVRQETEICQHMPACTLPTIDWPWSGNAPHPPTWFSTILPFRQPVWLLLRFRCILWGLLCNCLFILTPKKSNMYLTPAAKWAKWRKLNTDSRHRRF